MIPLHRLQYGSKMVTTGWYRIDENATFEREVFTNHIADSERVEHPLLKLILVDILRVGDEVEVTAYSLTVDYYSELLEDSVTPTVERSAMQLLAVAQIFIPLPAVGKFLMGNLPGPSDSINQPSVFLQLVHINIIFTRQS